MKVVFDTETTGLDDKLDEILQFSAIDENGNVLLNTYIRPEHTNEWADAARINGITPEMVKEAPTFGEIKAQIQSIFDSSEELIAYNGVFDINFLISAGIKFDFTRQTLYDVMLEFAPIYGEWNERFRDYKWQKLTVCAEYYGYKFKAHDSLEDVRATLHCYNAIKGKDKEWSVTEDIKTSGYKPTKKLVACMEKVNVVAGRKCSIRNLKSEVKKQPGNKELEKAATGAFRELNRQEACNDIDETLHIPVR